MPVHGCSFVHPPLLNYCIRLLLFYAILFASLSIHYMPHGMLTFSASLNSILNLFVLHAPILYDYVRCSSSVFILTLIFLLRAYDVICNLTSVSSYVIIFIYMLLYVIIVILRISQFAILSPSLPSLLFYSNLSVLLFSALLAKYMPRACPAARSTIAMWDETQ